MTRLWRRAKRRGLARWLRDFHYFMLAAWTVTFPLAIITGLWQSLAFVSMLSIYANWATEFGSVQGSRAEVAAAQTVEKAQVVEHADTVEAIP